MKHTTTRGAVAQAGALGMCVVGRIPHRFVEALGVHGWALRLVVVVAVVNGARALAQAPFSRLPAARPSLADEGKAFLVTVAAASAACLPLYWLLRATPHWWLFAGLLFAAVTVAGQLSLPLSVRFRSGPLVPAPPDLAGRIAATATRAGVDIGTACVAGRPGRSAANAYVVGLGPTRRIVLDGTLASWPPELVDQVVAHEIGHWRLGHASRRLPLAMAAQFATLALAAVVLSSPSVLRWAGISAIGDPRGFPLLLLLTPLLALPARCLLGWRDREQERAADEFALRLLAAPGDFAAMLERAATEGGAPRRLSWWRQAIASHPPIDQRLAACTRSASIA